MIEDERILNVLEPWIDLNHISSWEELLDSEYAMWTCYDYRKANHQFKMRLWSENIKFKNDLEASWMNDSIFIVTSPREDNVPSRKSLISSWEDVYELELERAANIIKSKKPLGDGVKYLVWIELYKFQESLWKDWKNTVEGGFRLSYISEHDWEIIFWLVGEIENVEIQSTVSSVFDDFYFQWGNKKYSPAGINVGSNSYELAYVNGYIWEIIFWLAEKITDIELRYVILKAFAYSYMGWVDNKAMASPTSHWDIDDLNLIDGISDSGFEIPETSDRVDPDYDPEYPDDVLEWYNTDEYS